MNATNASIQVFVTHKSGDIEKAEEFTQLLKLADGTGRLSFLFAEKMPAGVNFQQWIHQNVVEANVLFFLMISPTKDKDWNWCIYEAGLFAGRQNQQSNNRIIIFFNPSQHTLPPPLENLQAVRTDQSSVDNFLRQFYGTTDLTGVEPPLKSKLPDNVIHDLARDICSLLANNIQSSQGEEP